ncbi:MAG: hypothetical protein V1736_11240 [Pseudomonadota bacterium]
MNTVWHSLIVAAAFVIALIMLVLGIERRLPQWLGSRGKFTAAVVLFLALFHGAVPAEIPLAAAQSENAFSGNDCRPAESHVPTELADPQKWAAFKALWQKLDAVEPNDRTKGEPSPFLDAGSYGAISGEQAVQWQKELANLFGYQDTSALWRARRAFFAGILGEPEDRAGRFPGLSHLGFILAQICDDRITELSQPYALRLTRMIPAPARTASSRVMIDLEQQIDLLLKLNQKGMIGDEEAVAALGNIQRDLYLSAVLKLLEDCGGWPVMYRVVPVSEAEAGKATNAELLCRRTLDPEMDKTIFDPEAWVRGYERGLDAVLAAQKQKISEARDAPGGQEQGPESNASQESLRQELAKMEKRGAAVKAELKKLGEIRPRLNRLLADMER